MDGEPEPWFCYMLRCSDGHLYVGMTNDVPARVQKHNLGLGPEFTKKRRPVKLIWSQRFPDRFAAHKREIELKGWGREKKLNLVARLEKNEGQARMRVIGANPSRELTALAQGKGE